MKLRRLRAVSRKEFLHILRDPRSLGGALAIPLFMLILFGYGLTLDVDRVPTIVRDHDATAQSRDLTARFTASRYFDVLGHAGSYEAIENSIDRDRALAAIVIPRGFARDLLAGRTASVQVIIDGSDSNTAGIARGYVDSIIAGYSREVRAESLERRGAGELRNPVETRLRVLYNSEMKSRNYIVPGLIAVIVAIIATLITSLTIAREWENGTMEQLLSTPVRPAELVLGKMSAYIVLGAIDTLVSVLVGVFLFDVPLRGNPLRLIIPTFLFLFGSLAWGLMISAIARSQVVAYQLAMVSSFLPAFLLSGFVFSIETMPAPIQVITHIVPARYFVTSLKGIFLKNVSSSVLAGELAFLIVYAAVVFAVATRKLRQKVA
ncbi:MAG TPA: ABC transporter permease [Bryobacteraceae bacterium]|nr:ABC transporter permease [Bryobacteraceae bacterium]